MNTEKLRELAAQATFDRTDPSTYLRRKRLAKAWPTESDLDRDGFGVWFGDPRDDAYIAALSPDVVLQLLDTNARLRAALNAIVSLPAVVPDHPHGGVHPPYLEWNEVAKLARAALEPIP